MERVGGRHVLADGGRAVLVTYSGFFDWTSRGPLHLMVLQAAVQWLAAGCGDACVDRERSPDRPLVARGKLTCYEWLCLRLSGASGAQSGWSPASQADMASTGVGAVAPGCSAARLLRYFGLRQIFSFFRPSGAATHLWCCAQPHKQSESRAGTLKQCAVQP